MQYLKSFHAEERLELRHGISKNGARKSELRVQRDRKLFLVLSQSLKVELWKDGLCYLGKSELAVAKHRATSHLAGYREGSFHLLSEIRPDIAYSLIEPWP